jgi:Fe-S cluster biogenesis protein NfuA
MSSLRGVAGFEELWARRTTIEVAGESIDLLAIEDLMRAKKTQRDKDWPMIRRLQQSYFRSYTNVTDESAFLLRGACPALARTKTTLRATVQTALTANLAEVRRENSKNFGWAESAHR